MTNPSAEGELPKADDYVALAIDGSNYLIPPVVDGGLP
jgi:hypothetical protein